MKQTVVMTLISRYPVTPAQQALATMVALLQKPPGGKSPVKAHSPLNKGSSMKRLIWLAGVALALASTENTQALSEPYKVNLHAEGPLGTSSATLNKNIKAAIASTFTAHDLNASQVKPMLSSLSLQGHISSTSLASNDRYMPASLVTKFNPHTPKEPSQPTTSAGGKTPAGTATVADGGATAGLFGIALLGTGLMKRKLAA
jgi:hypothetical protein